MKSVNLFYRDPAQNSDKVYAAQIVDVDGGGNAYRVEFQFGKRGAKLAEGNKTPVPVSLALAESIFAKLVREKMAKGYTEDSGGTPFDGDAARLADVLPHPRKTIVTLDEARQWSAADYLIQRKLDGVLARREVAGATLLGELVTVRSGAHLTPADRALIAEHGSFFAAFTVEAVHGENALPRTTRCRWGILSSLAPHFPPDVVLVTPATVPDALTTEEGYVAHPWGAGWGEMLAVKQEQIYDCEVTGIGGSQSVEVKVLATGATCRVKMGGGKADQVQKGSRIRVECLNLTDDGKLFQPRPCRDWLVNY